MNNTTENTKRTYHLEAGLERMVSPVTLIFPDRKRLDYKNGTEAAAAAFDRPYEIHSIAAVDDTIGIMLVDPSAPDHLAIKE